MSYTITTHPCHVAYKTAQNGYESTGSLLKQACHFFAVFLERVVRLQTLPRAFFTFTRPLIDFAADGAVHE